MSVGDKRHIERGPAHVTGDHIVEPGGTGDLPRGDNTCGRPRQGRSHRQRLCGIDRHHAAIRLHDQNFCGRAFGFQPVLEPRQIACHDRLEIGVQAGRGTALEFANFRQDFGRHADMLVRPCFAQDCGGTRLVIAIRVTVDEEQADGLAFLFQQCRCGGADFVRVDLCHHLAAGKGALGHLEAALPFYDRRELSP